jgi:putative CocE/NonD family hydrolase
VTAPLEIAGPLHVHLRASSSATDTDFAAILADVDATGRAVFISHGILRASFRESLSEPELLVPGEVYDLSIEMADIAHVVLPGHALRLIVCSALFPYYHPNPNTGALYGDEEDGVYATVAQTVFCGEDEGSRLQVFVRPLSAG